MKTILLTGGLFLLIGIMIIIPLIILILTATKKIEMKQNEINNEKTIERLKNLEKKD